MAEKSKLILRNNIEKGRIEMKFEGLTSPYLSMNYEDIHQLIGSLTVLHEEGKKWLARIEYYEKYQGLGVFNKAKLQEDVYHFPMEFSDYVGTDIKDFPWIDELKAGQTIEKEYNEKYGVHHLNISINRIAETCTISTSSAIEARRFSEFMYERFIKPKLDDVKKNGV